MTVSLIHTIKSLLRSEERERAPRQWRCPICDACFTDEKQFKYHQVEEHTSQEER